jgi:hypothetical protein
VSIPTAKKQRPAVLVSAAQDSQIRRRFCAAFDRKSGLLPRHEASLETLLVDKTPSER